MTFKLPSPSGEEIEAASRGLYGVTAQTPRTGPIDSGLLSGMTRALAAARPVLEQELQERIERALMVAISLIGDEFALEYPGEIERTRTAFWHAFAEVEK